MGSFQRLRSPIADQQTLTGLELIAFGVPAEIVVIVENQNLRVGSRERTEEVCRGETTDASTYYHKVIGLFLVDSIGPSLSISNGMRHFPGSIVVPAHTGLSGRVVVRILLRSGFGLGQQLEPFGTRCERPANGQSATIQEITPGNAAVHSERAVLSLAHAVLL